MEKDIGKVKKNDNTEIIVRIDDFGGKRGITIREYTTSERYTGFTKSGTRIAAETFKDFKALINSIDEKDLEGEVAPAEPKETAEPKAKKAAKKKTAEEEGIF
jgi:hypothetical protein